MYALSGPEFFAMAFRLPVYQGCVRLRMEEQQRQQTHPGHSTTQDLDLGEDELEARRNEHRISRTPKALRPGEQPQHVPLHRIES